MFLDGGYAMISTSYYCTAPTSARSALETCFEGEDYYVSEEDGKVTVGLKTIARVAVEIANKIIEMSKILPDVVFNDHYCADVGSAYHVIDTAIQNGEETIIQDFVEYLT